ncbi:MAG: type III pantothenate kinase [Eubacteriales bacterium]|nr:type III pantothenate kinase [Eubacteriales bacterium]
MILAIDVGNTNIVIGCLEKEATLFTSRYSTDRSKTEDEYALLLMDMFRFHGISPSDIEGGIISSVVPELKKVFQLAVEKLTGKCPMIVDPAQIEELNIKIDNPAQLGSDLVVNAVAALDKYPKPILIFDMGTATTLSVIDEKGDYIGGMIIPGLRLSVDALSARTSQLPRISLDAPKQLIGTNTINCMKAGAIYGNAAMLDGIIERIEEELGKTPTVVATGGLICEVVPYCKRKIIIDKNLMLWGLGILYKANQKK